ncbi:MAG: transposase, partial [Magnetococcales bacterium]|nr:transposase [Magnetococcales bacterium]
LQGVEGSSHGLILSLLVDHCLLLHPDQLARLKQNKPAFTVGSLINAVKIESLLTTIRTVLAAEDPEQKLAEMADQLAKLFPLATSEKHMAGRDLGRQEPTPSLRHYKKAA